MCYLTVYVISEDLLTIRRVQSYTWIFDCAGTWREVLLRLAPRTPALFNSQLYLEWLSTSSPSQKVLELRVKVKSLQPTSALTLRIKILLLMQTKGASTNLGS